MSSSGVKIDGTYRTLLFFNRCRSSSDCLMSSSVSFGKPTMNVYTGNQLLSLRMLVPSTTISCQSWMSNGSALPDMVSAARRGEPVSMPISGARNRLSGWVEFRFCSALLRSSTFDRSRTRPGLTTAGAIVACESGR